MKDQEQGGIKLTAPQIPNTGTAYRIDIRLGNKDYATGWTQPFNTKILKIAYAQALRRLAKEISK